MRTSSGHQPNSTHISSQVLGRSNMRMHGERGSAFVPSTEEKMCALYRVGVAAKVDLSD